MKSMKVLVTGAAGYVGSTLVEELLWNRDPFFSVMVLDRGDFTPLIRPICDHKIEVVRGDITNENVLDAAMDGVDAVIHLAGIVGFPACDADPSGSNLTNLIGTKLIVERMDGRPIVFSSTQSVYGNAKICQETTKMEPTSRYGEQKRNAELCIWGCPSGTVLRFATGCGVSPKMRFDTVPNNFTWKALKDGCLPVFQASAKRSFIHVKDMARALIWALEPRKHKIYNVGSPELSMEKGKIAEIVGEVTGAKIILDDYSSDKEQRDGTVSYERICGEGFRCDYTNMRDIIRELTTVMRVL